MNREMDNIYLTREHIIEQMKGQIGDLINAYSLNGDLILFKDYIKDEENDIFEIKSIWLKYMRKIFNELGHIRFEYHHPYKSAKLNYVCELSVYINDEYKYGQQYSSRIDAECQGYIANLCEFRIMSPQKLADTINNILEKELKTYNYIHNDEAKFVVDNLNMLGAESKKLTHSFGIFLFNALSKDEVLRGSKIDKLLS